MEYFHNLVDGNDSKKGDSYLKSTKQHTLRKRSSPRTETNSKKIMVGICHPNYSLLLLLWISLNDSVTALTVPTTYISSHIRHIPIPIQSQSIFQQWKEKDRKKKILMTKSSSGSDKIKKNMNKKAKSESINQLMRENDFLKRQIQLLTDENERLETQIKLEQRSASSRLILETFEGENQESSVPKWFENVDFENGDNDVYDQMEQQDSLDDNGKSKHAKNKFSQTSEYEPDCETDIFGIESCPVEPDVTFKDALRDRAYWLVGLLALQSCSGFILARNEILLQKHPVIVYFLTMLVGAGGNAGNQASVRVIRGLALGTLNEKTRQQFLNRELKMALSLSTILSVAGFLRAIIFRTPLPETIAITSALSVIVFVSICLGAVLPLLLKELGIDPAHSSTSIQVVMDILGVVLTVFVSTLLLDSAFGQSIVAKLSSSF